MRTSSDSKDLRRNEPEALTDPVCGMTVDPTSAAGSSKHNGETYYFCSRHCLEKFREDPERFLNSPAPRASAQLTNIGRAAANEAASGNPEEIYTCPMHPEVRQSKPGSCPKCGMSLERVAPQTPAEKIDYTCPMHPQIVRDKPGNCPICGMALEPRTVSLEEEKNPELVDMTRRFWVGVVLTAPLLLIAMSDFLPGNSLERIVSMRSLGWIQLVLATPVVLWGGWPFFVRGWQSIVNRSLNMFTLISLGVAVAYVFSVIAKLFPEIFPSSFRDPSGVV
ncbi:MAG: YHS domain-containing protein, partial [Acidobacteriota bacterium]|nr:YHS domain-containing protein [Acidobacteriota bacterium]